MKKILFALLITASFISCKKDNGCWVCTKTGTYNGVTYNGEKETICNGSDQPPAVTDNTGTVIGGNCVKK